MGTNGMRYVKSNYRWSEVVQRFVDVYARWRSPFTDCQR